MHKTAVFFYYSSSSYFIINRALREHGDGPAVAGAAALLGGAGDLRDRYLRLWTAGIAKGCHARACTCVVLRNCRKLLSGCFGEFCLMLTSSFGTGGSFGMSNNQKKN